MADRTVAVRLLARVDDYKRNMGSAAAATKQFGSTAAAHTKAASQELSELKAQSTIAGAGMIALAGAAVVAAAGFDKSMSNVKAVSGATVDEMERLRKAALDAGQATVFSASEAADAEAELAKAGVGTADILGGALRGSLDLAAAGSLDLASSATIAAQAMNVFDLAGRDVAHIADVLAAGANKSAADISQLGDALRQGGLVAKQTGLGLEDTVGVLSAFADNALIGSDAGTSLKTMLQRLTPQSAEAADKMAELGINAYDASGQFVGISKFAGILQNSLKDLTPEARNSALAIIFGSDAVRAANVLYEEGAQGIDEYVKAVDDSGAASRMAATQLDNLAGDIEALKGSIETGLIQAGSGANDTLRKLTQFATGVVNEVSDLPEPILATGLAVTAMSGAFLIAAPRVVAFNAALAASPALARTASLALKSIAPVAAVAALAEIGFAVQAANDDLVQLQRDWEGMRKELTKDISTAGADQLFAKITELEDKLSNPTFTDKLARGWDELMAWDTEDQTNVDKQLAALQEMQGEYEKYKDVVRGVAAATGADFARAIELVDQSGVGLDGTVAQVVSRVRDYVDATQTGSVTSHDAADAMDDLSDSTLSAEDQLKGLKAQWDATIGAMLGVSDAQIAAERSLDDLTAALKKNGATFDINTEKGRDNRSAFNDLIDAAGRLREKKLEETGSVDEANAAYRKYLDRLAKAPGLTDAERNAVKKLIDKYAQLPATKTTTVTANTEPARTALSKLASYYSKLFNSSYAVGGSTYQSQVPAAARRARGGPVVGPGTGTSDSVHLRASNGEWVVKKSSVDKYGRSFMDAVNSGTYNPAAAIAAASPAVPAPQRVVVTVRSDNPVNFILDGQTVATSLLRYRGDLQGAPLGFDS